jgi:precorrin-3B synthase
MESGDGMLVRLRPPGGILDSAAARLIAAAATASGNGAVELTQRAAIQVRGLRPDTIAPFAETMRAAGLAAPDSVAVMRSPLGEADDVADAVARAMTGVSGLPAKFCVAVDGGGALPLGEVGADIRVACGASGCVVAPAGADAAVRCDPADAPAVVQALAAAFLGLSSRSDPPLRRMRALAAGAVFAAAGLTPDAAWLPARTRPAVGPVGGDAFGLGLPLGMCDLQALADLADRHGGGAMRLTPWRAVMLTGVADPAALSADADGFITSPDDPRGRIVACPGAPACASATVATRDFALRLAALDRPGIIHVSGCAKLCAHPGPAALAFVGRNGGFEVVRDGRAA